MPAASADLAVRLLLRHAQWWDQLAADDHQLLHELGGEHGALIAWLEARLHEYGAETWAALDEALQGHDLQPAAVRIADPASLADCHEFADLERVLHRLWEARLNVQIADLIAGAASAGPDRNLLEQVASLRARADAHKRRATAA